jgi:hypothetical protein
MGIFDLFKKHNRPVKQNSYNIFDEFSMDIRMLDKSEFTKEGEEINSTGSKIIKYCDYLPEKELGIFERLEFIEFENGERNIFFKGFVHDMPMAPLIDLVNRLYKGLGKDSVNNGQFENWEIDAIQNMTWTGRFYSNIEFPICLSQDDIDIELSILGIRTSKL